MILIQAPSQNYPIIYGLPFTKDERNYIRAQVSKKLPLYVSRGTTLSDLASEILAKLLNNKYKISDRQLLVLHKEYISIWDREYNINECTLEPKHVQYSNLAIPLIIKNLREVKNEDNQR